MKKPQLRKKGLSKAAGGAMHTLESAFGVVFKILGTILLIIMTTGSILAVVFSIYISRYLKVDMSINLKDYDLRQTSTVTYTDRDSGLSFELGTLHGQQNRKLAAYEEIPGHMIEALVSIEDKRFFQHDGVDWKRTVGAFTQMFMPGGSSFGGSTITQQLIKNLTEEKDFTVARKVQEILRALDFEKRYSKEEILEMYLNTCYFGQGCYGVKTAAETYFGKTLDQLTAAESASIIGITNKPTLYNPFLNPDKNKDRQETILNQMFVQGMLSQVEYNRAKYQPLVFVSPIDDGDDYYDLGRIQSYFIDQIFFDVRNDLVARKEITEQYANMLIYGGGLTIESTIDTRIQGIIDEVYSNDENFPVVKDSEKPQSSLLILDPYSGEVLGFAGGRGIKTGNLVRNLPNHAQRQPGSAIKPVTVYAAAFDMGFITPYSVIDDIPSDNNGAVWPRNSGGAYRGRTNVITAVQNSVNTIAVRIVESITPAKAFYFGRDTLGLKSLVEERWVTRSNDRQEMLTDIQRSPLALGGLTRGLTVRELTAAYATFANRGMYSAPHTYKRVLDANGNVLLDNNAPPEVAIKEKTAHYMNVVLQQAVTSGTGARARLTDMPTAGKTGTTNDDFDRWFTGYTPYYAGGSWYGFTIPKKIRLEQSTNPALAMWKLVMDEIHEDLERREFFKPDGLVNASYCLDSGFTPTDNCRLDPRGSRVATGAYFSEDVPKMPCNVHTLVDVDKESGRLATPYCPGENLTKVALLNIGRGLIASGVHVWDEQYTVRYWGGGGPDIPEGRFRPAASGADGAPPYNTFCHLHEVEILPPPPEPGDGDWFNNLFPTAAPTPTLPPEPGDPGFIPQD
ncbi:MAG: transglycosylase domain-containing protein [Oscillospiraceae bacterium]|nr:transglycosylase domain-containing protein [Oscillospiraceae bacterium]